MLGSTCLVFIFGLLVTVNAQAENGVKASDLMVKCLRKYGVRQIYGIAGEAIPDFMISLLEQTGPDPIQFITTRHEQGAAFMAYGTSIVNLREGGDKIVPGVCMTTQGAGALNLVTGLAAAQLDQVPVIAITGQVTQLASFKHGFQRIDVRGVMEPIVKWSVTIAEPDNLAEIVAQAFRLALTPPYGVVHIEFPVDVGSSYATINTEPLKVNFQPRFTLPDMDLVQNAFNWIEGHARTLIIVGPDLFTRLHGEQIAYEMLREFVSITHIPVIAAPGGKGALLSTDIHYMYTSNFVSRDWPDEVVKWASLLVYIGFNRGEMSPERWNKIGTPVIHINHYPAIVEREYFPELEIEGDIGAVLAELVYLAEGSSRSWEVHPAIPTIRGLFAQTLLYPGEEIKENHVFQGFAALDTGNFMKQFNEEAVVVLDSGIHQFWMRRNVDFNWPHNLISSNILSPVGVGLPTTLGAARAYAVLQKCRKILLVTGDAGFVLNMAEMSTLLKLMQNGEEEDLAMKVVVLVWDDSTHAIVEWNQDRLFNKHYDLSVINPRFEKLAESIPGWIGMPPITNRSQISPTLEAAFAHSSPGVLLSIRIDEDQNEQFTDYLLEQLPPPPSSALPSRRSQTQRIVYSSSFSSSFGGACN